MLIWWIHNTHTYIYVVTCAMCHVVGVCICVFLRASEAYTICLHCPKAVNGRRWCQTRPGHLALHVHRASPVGHHTPPPTIRLLVDIKKTTPLVPLSWCCRFLSKRPDLTLVDASVRVRSTPFIITDKQISKQQQQQPLMANVQCPFRSTKRPWQTMRTLITTIHGRAIRLRGETGRCPLTRFSIYTSCSNSTKSKIHTSVYISISQSV